MDKPPIKYRPLTGSSRKMFGLFSSARHRLWAADDHILNQEMRAYSESCKRFYFHDIQAIVITRTKAGRTLSIIIALLSALFVMIALIGVGAGNLPALTRVVICCSFSGIFLIALLINWLLGPTCKTRLYTAVQAEDLVSLSRLRTAQKVVAMLRPMIEAAQGRLTPEALDASSAETVSAIPSASADTAAPLPFARPASAEPEIRHERGNYHAAFFALNLLFAASALIDIFWQHRIKNHIDTLMLLPFVALAIVALVKQRHSDLPQDIKVMPWLSLGFLMLMILYILFYTPIYAISHPEFLKNGYPTPLEGPVFLVFLSIEAVVYSSFGLIGLMRVNRFQAGHDAAGTRASSAAGPGAANAS